MTYFLTKQEQARNNYWHKTDHFLSQRLQWRAEMVRHCFHLFPEDSILELGCGSGDWTEVLSSLKNNRNPICAATFDKECFNNLTKKGLPQNIEAVHLDSFPGKLENRQFDFIVSWDLWLHENYNQILFQVKKLLKPGGQILFFGSNPWNPFYNIRKLLSNVFPSLKRSSDGVSTNRIELYSAFSEIGFTNIKILPYDFLFPPIPKFLLWPMQNLSLIFENTPYLRNMAGSLYVWAKNPAPETWTRPVSNLAEHDHLKGKVSVVVPCHNEEPNIPSLVNNLRACYDDYLHEIILVDDNSKDGTFALAESLSKEDPRIKVIKRTMPNGVGRALRDGFSAATGEYLLTMDCDFQSIIPELTCMFDSLAKGNDMVIGSRFSRNSVLLNYAFTKILANRGFHIIANLTLGIKVRDVTNNLKLMKLEVAKNINIESDDFAANAETGIKPILMGYKVEEVPVSWINRSLGMGLSKFKLFKTGPTYFSLLLRFIWKKRRMRNRNKQ